MTLILGIDPGVSGALVLLHGDEVLSWLQMPTTKLGAANRVNGAALAAYVRTLHLCDLPGPLVAHLEDVHAMPVNGSKALFSLGHAAGVVAGVLGALGVSTTYVSPTSWKRRAGIPPKADKDASRALAVRLWPDWRELDTKAHGQALADAALIARHGGVQ